MDEERLRQLLNQLMGTGSTPNLQQKWLFPDLAANMARTGEDFYPTTLQDSLRSASGDVTVVDGTKPKAQPVSFWDKISGQFQKAIGNIAYGPYAAPKVSPEAAKEMAGGVANVWGQANELARPLANAMGFGALSNAMGLGQASATAPATIAGAGRDAPGVQAPVPVTPMGVANPAAFTPTLQQLSGPAPVVPPNEGPGLNLGTLSLALQTPAIQQALAAFGQAIAGAGNPVNVIGDAASQMAQGQMVQNALAGGGSGLGPTSSAGMNPENVQQVLDQQNTQRRLEQEERALGIQERAVGAQEQTALANLMKAQYPGLEGWQWTAIKQNVANEWYDQARSNLLAKNPSLASLVDIETILGSAATGVNADAVFTNLSPEQRSQAAQQASTFTSQVEQGAPFSSVVGAYQPGQSGAGQQTGQQAPTISSAAQFQSLSVGSTFMSPDGRLRRKTGQDTWEFAQ